MKGPEGPSGLSPRAEDLLILLCRNAGETVSREQIFEQVWPGRVVEEAAISNAVWQIRKALGEQGKEILQTRPKRGYALIVPQVRDEDLADAGGGVAGVENEARPQTEPVHDPSARPDVPPGALPVARARVGGIFSRKTATFAVAGAILIASALLAWGMGDTRRFALAPGDEVSVFVDTDGVPPWLASAILRSTVEAVEAREAQAVRFEQPQRRNPFSSLHVEVSITSIASTSGTIAVFSLDRGGVHVRERFVGSEHRLPAALASFLDRHLDPSPAKPTPAFDDYVSGRTAWLLYDNNSAIQHYRGALAKSPAHLPALLGMSEILQDQGRGRELLEQLAAIDRLKGLSSSVRCRVDIFLVSRAPERLPPKPCERAATLAAAVALDNRETLRKVQHRRWQLRSPTDWKTDEIAAILALIGLQEFAQAESAIDSAAAIAGEAGWRHAQVEIQALRARIAMNSGKFERFARQRWESADAAQALGNVDLAHFYRLEAIYGTRIVPGDRVGELRRELIGIADQARARGNVANEIEALRLRLTLERDNPVEWRAMIERIEALMHRHYAPDIAARDSVQLINELRAQRRFQDALNALTAQAEYVERDVALRLWHRFIRFGAHFARDELSDAALAVDALEKEQFDLADGGDLCRYAWLFVELRDWPRAELYLRRCLAIEYDRKSRADEGDPGLVAQSRMYALLDQPQSAWSSLRPRIAELLATADLDRREAESLTLLARHAAALPGADIPQLQRALTRAEAMATLDGAGPGLRFGVHMLRWRLCRRAGRNDCGPVLPEWAPEDRFEARLAREGVGGALER